MSTTQIEKATRFRTLHERPGPFVIPNPWDVASTLILEGLGFEALATSSAASACAVGRRDGELTRHEALAHARMIVNATDLPVSADLERGFGDTPGTVAETIRLAADVGLVGCTIEDTTGDQTRPLYDFGLAVERVAAAAHAARALGFPFILTARAHNMMYANPSLDETIKRLQAFERALRFFLHPVFLISTRCEQSVAPCRNQLILWWVLKASPFPSPNSPPRE